MSRRLGRSNRHNDGLAFVCASIAQQTGDRRCNQLKPYVIEQRRERNLLRDRADLDLLKSFSGQQALTSSASGKMCSARMHSGFASENGHPIARYERL